jgi:hypothetical protein
MLYPAILPPGYAFADGHHARWPPACCACNYWPSWALIISSILALTALKLNEAGACMGG